MKQQEWNITVIVKSTVINPLAAVLEYKIIYKYLVITPKNVCLIAEPLCTILQSSKKSKKNLKWSIAFIDIKINDNNIMLVFVCSSVYYIIYID